MPAPPEAEYIITYFKLIVNQNTVSTISFNTLIITYFKLIVNQNARF